MNILSSSFNYFQDILSENSGAKALVTDDETIKSLGLSISRTEVLGLEVLATETLRDILSKPQGSMLRSLRAICILRPNDECIELLCNELSDPHFSKYSLYFTNLVQEDMVRKLASFDKMGLIDRFEEVFTDFFPINSRLFHTNQESVANVRLGKTDGMEVHRMGECMFSALCALQIRPCIRYDATSSICSELASITYNKVNQTIGTFGPIKDNALLLILDRRIDPITPIISSWYYTSAIHFLFGITNNMVTIPKTSNQFVLDERHDSFYAEYSNKFLSEIGPAVAGLTKEAISLNQVSKQKISSPDQIPGVVTAASKFQTKMTVANEHVTLLEAINSAVEEKGLLGACEVEQALATGDDAAFHASEIIRLAQNPDIPHDSIVRLALLFALRYEDRAPEQTAAIRKIAGADGSLLMDAIITMCGVKLRQHEDVFSNKSALKRLFTDIRMICDAKQNILAQYRCLLFDILRRVRVGNLDESAYPFKGPAQKKPQKVVVFFVGGATFEEGRAAFEVSRGDMDVVVGGTYIHNPQSFVRNEVSPFQTQ